MLFLQLLHLLNITDKTLKNSSSLLVFILSDMLVYVHREYTMGIIESQFCN